MADNHVTGSGSLTALASIVLWIFSKIAVSDLAAFLSITVGLYSLYINWPNFKKRLSETFKKKK